MKIRVLGGLVMLLAVGARAQTTEAELRAKLVGAPLILKGCYQADDLHFDSTGQALNGGDVGPFTLSGVDVKKVELHGDELLLKGRRVGLKFSKKGQERIAITSAGAFSRHDEDMTITLAKPAGGDFGPVLTRVFAFDLKEMVPTMPAVWQVWADRVLVRGEGLEQIHDPALGTRKIGGEVSPPRALSMPEPEFTQEARKMKLSGVSLIYLTVDADGSPQGVRVARPAGMGLDEKAVEAVRLYKFQPAKENGVPVKVEMQVEVNFKVY